MQNPDINLRIAEGRNLSLKEAKSLLSINDQRVQQAVIKNPAISSEIVALALDMQDLELTLVISSALKRSDLTSSSLRLLFSAINTNSAWSENGFRDQKIKIAKNPNCPADILYYFLKSQQKSARETALNVFSNRDDLIQDILNLIIEKAGESLTDSKAILMLLNNLSTRIALACNEITAYKLGGIYRGFYQAKKIPLEIFGDFVKNCEHLPVSFIEEIKKTSPDGKALLGWLSVRPDLSTKQTEVIMENGSVYHLSQLSRHTSSINEIYQHMVERAKGHDKIPSRVLVGILQNQHSTGDVVKSIICEALGNEQLANNHLSNILEAAVSREDIHGDLLRMIMIKARSLRFEKVFTTASQRNNLELSHIELAVDFLTDYLKSSDERPLWAGFLAGNLLKYSPHLSRIHSGNLVIAFAETFTGGGAFSTYHHNMRAEHLRELFTALIERKCFKVLGELIATTTVKDLTFWTSVKSMACMLGLKDIAIAITQNENSDVAPNTPDFLSISGGNGIHKAYVSRITPPSDEILAQIEEITRSKVVKEKIRAVRKDRLALRKLG